MASETFRERFKRDPVVQLGEPCAHGGSPIDCRECFAEMVASLPPVATERCREHLIEDLRVVKSHCSHGLTAGRLGQAVVCDRCGWAAHRWQGFVCGRARPKQSEIESENARCPIQDRLRAQKLQAVPR